MESFNEHSSIFSLQRAGLCVDGHEVMLGRKPRGFVRCRYPSINFITELAGFLTMLRQS
jgi:hypothetical protein